MTTIIDIFPVEILDHIIDIIADDDNRQQRCEWPNVKACSLTCRTLAPLCRRHIFRCVKLFDFDRSPRQVSTGKPSHPLARSFGELITNKPEIADYVQEIDFMVTNINDGGPISALVALERLAKLETLSISPVGGMGLDDWNWQQLHFVPRLIFNKLLRCPRVTTVKVICIFCFPIPDLLPCTYLQRLTFQYGLIKDNAAPPPTPSKPVQLRELNTVHPQPGNGDKLLKLKHKDGTPIFDITELKKFNSCIYGKANLPYAAEVIKSATNLEEIHLFVMLAQDEPWDTLANLLSPSLKALRCLSIACHLERSRSDHYYDIISALKNLSSTNRIELLKLAFQNYRFYGRTLSINYDSLKECILGLGWPFLTRIELSIFDWCREEGDSTNHSMLQNSVVTFHRLSPDALLELRVYNYKGSMETDKAAYGC